MDLFRRMQTISFAIFVFTARVFKNRGYSLLLLFWALLMSYSRIYSGVHYPLDIIGGAHWLAGDWDTFSLKH